jgi:hypothetical protein
MACKTGYIMKAQLVHYLLAVPHKFFRSILQAIERLRLATATSG